MLAASWSIIGAYSSMRESERGACTELSPLRPVHGLVGGAVGLRIFPAAPPDKTLGGRFGGRSAGQDVVPALFSILGESRYGRRNRLDQRSYRIGCSDRPAEAEAKARVYQPGRVVWRIGWPRG